jgi:hypothetical protein
LGISEDRSVTINKNSPSGSTTFSDTKTSDQGYVRNLTIETSDKGTITEAKILVNAENAAWRSNSSGMNSYQVRFTGTQNAGAASDGSTKKQYVPKFHGQAEVKGNGGHGTPETYSWNVQASYYINDHEPIIEGPKEVVTPQEYNSQIKVTLNSSENTNVWYKYDNVKKHPFSVTDPPDSVMLYQVPSYSNVPHTSADKVACCVTGVRHTLKVKRVAAIWERCEICQANNKLTSYVAVNGSIASAIQIHMPEWINTDIASNQSVEMWEDWWNKLLKHEKHHWKISADIIFAIKTWADTINGKSFVIKVCNGNNREKTRQKSNELVDQKINQLTALIKENAGEDENELISKINEQQEQYDTATDHGTNDGVNSTRFEQPWRIAN